MVTIPFAPRYMLNMLLIIYHLYDTNYYQLDQPMQLLIKDNTAMLLDRDTLIAEAKVADFQLNIPTPISFEEASDAPIALVAYEATPFQTCFVCGANRAEGDGLRIQSNTIGPQKIAAPWIPFANLGDDKGIVQEAFIWAALDCPGVWAAIQEETQFYLLGRMATRIVNPVIVGKKYVIMGWVIATEGRKTWTGTAIYDEKGRSYAYAKSTWISINTLK